MKWKQAPTELVALFTKLVHPLRGTQTRKMFGYPAAFVNGHMFAGLFQEEMFLRLAPKDQHDFKQQAGAYPFEPMPGHAMREYLVVPTSLLKDPARLRRWLGQSLAYTKSLPAKARKGR
jgi:TfoX/Sxy family transcriptional regulator of competence genes